MNMYYFINGFLLNIYFKSLSQYLAIIKNVGLNYVTSILFVNISYIRSKIAPSLIRLKNLELGFFNLLGGRDKSVSAMFLLGVTISPAMGGAESRSRNIVIRFFE